MEESLKQETLNRWEEGEDGKFISNDEIIAWLETWGTETEQKRPECK